MADDAVILRNPYHQVAYEEFDAGGAITPGDLLQVDADGDVSVNGTAAQTNPESLWADLSPDPENDKSDAYAANERVRAFYGRRGMVIDAFIANNETIAVGDVLVSNGDGALREINTAGGETRSDAVAIAEEAVSPTGGEVRCEVRLL